MAVSSQVAGRSFIVFMAFFACVFVRGDVQQTYRHLTAFCLDVLSPGAPLLCPDFVSEI